MTIFLFSFFFSKKVVIQDLGSFLQSTVEDSIVRHGFHLSADGKAYVSDFLTRFVGIGQLFREYQWNGETEYGLKPISLQHFAALEEKGLAEKTVALQNLAEECLFLVGYCYDFIRKNGLGQVRFHSDMGVAAYGGLAALTGQQLFPEVAQHFDSYSVVVGDLHIPELKNDDRRLKRVLDCWMETRDQRYALLIEGVLGSTVVSSLGMREKEIIN